jgi:DNA-directed RNA polymerase subunit M/transcription elongation factor TFIIS
MDLDEFIPTHGTRRNAYNKLLGLLKEYIIESSLDICEGDVQKMGLNIERGIFNYTINNSCMRKRMWDDSFAMHYKSRLIVIYTNLNPKSYLGNVNLIKRLFNREFTEFEMCNFGPDQMFPERWAEHLKEYGSQEDLGKKLELEDGFIKCGKCKSYKTEYTEMQTRSADEPTTKFAYCHNCQNRWRFC